MTESESGDESTAEGPGLAVAAVGREPSVEDDPAIAAVAEALDDAGFTLSSRESLEAGFDNVQSNVGALADRRDVDLVVTVGGVGVGPRDVTVDALRPLYDRTLPGVGELFRQLAREAVSTGVAADRSAAGVIQGVPVVSLPGDGELARLGARELLAPEAANLVAAANGDRSVRDGTGPDDGDGD